MRKNIIQEVKMVQSLNDTLLITLGNDIRTRAAEMGWTNLDSGSWDVYEPIAAWYNSISIPDFWVWRTSVWQDEWRDAVMNGGGAIQLDALSASKRESLLWAISGSLDPSKSVVRQALADFCGTQATLKASLVTVSMRKANNSERVFATGTGTTASPANLVYEGGITPTNIERAMQLTAGN